MVPMSAFIPVNTAYLQTTTGRFTAGGAPLMAEKVRVGISIVRLANQVGQTSVRADRSGSKSYADEEVFKGRILMHPRHKPQEGDVLTIHGVEYTIEGVREVFAMDGRIDHYQVEL